MRVTVFFASFVRGIFLQLIRHGLDLLPICNIFGKVIQGNKHPLCQSLKMVHAVFLKVKSESLLLHKAG